MGKDDHDGVLWSLTRGRYSVPTDRLMSVEEAIFLGQLARRFGPRGTVRVVFDLCFQLGFFPAEAAEIMGVERSTVSRSLRKIEAELRHVLEEDFERPRAAGRP